MFLFLLRCTFWSIDTKNELKTYIMRYMWYYIRDIILCLQVILDSGYFSHDMAVVTALPTQHHSFRSFLSTGLFITTATLIFTVSEGQADKWWKSLHQWLSGTCWFSVPIQLYYTRPSWKVITTQFLLNRLKWFVQVLNAKQCFFNRNITFRRLKWLIQTYSYVPTNSFLVLTNQLLVLMTLTDIFTLKLNYSRF